MGQYFKIVNPVKRQYLDPMRFYESVKASGFLYGYHAFAVALLVCNSEEVRHDYGPLAGSWFGDPIIAAGDDNGQPDRYGVKTSTEEDPTRNLNQMARDEFEDVSYKALAMLCEGREGFAREIVERSAEQPGDRFLLDLGNVVFQVGCEPLKHALIEIYGADWTKKYKEARQKYRWSKAAE